MAGLLVVERRVVGRSSKALVNAMGSRQTIVQFTQKISRVVTCEPSARVRITGWKTVPLQMGQQR